jgi:hydroxymethylglutaryl-CoA synthase
VAGIISWGAYIPSYRLKRSDIAKVWGLPAVSGEKAVTNFDEDSITMAVEAAINCLGDLDRNQLSGLFFASTTSPYREKQAAGIVVSAADLPRGVRAEDFTNSLRSGTIALGSALDAINAGSCRNLLVVASDSRLGKARSRFELELGDGAAAVMIGNSNVIANVEGTQSFCEQSMDTWRAEADTTVRSSEERFIADRCVRIVQKTISELMAKCGLTKDDFAKVVYYAPDTRSHVSIARVLGFDIRTQVQDPLFTMVGNTGAASGLMMLVGALEEAKPGDRILFANYGDGCDAFIFHVTEQKNKVRNNRGIKGHLNSKMMLDSYEKYASWRGLIEEEPPSRPPTTPPSTTCLWRESKAILALYGVKCKSCGTVQYPPQRVCIACHTKDNFEDYRFSDKRAKIFTYGIDYLTSSKDPPVVFAIVDFDGGGRMSCEVTDRDPSKIAIDMPVEMAFRRLYEAGGIYNYFWKARPIRAD